MNNKVKEFMGKVEGKEFTSYEELIQFGRDNAKVYECITPHLDENMGLKYQLRDREECLNKDMCGNCHKCEYMIQAFSEDGTFFSFGVYDLVCAY